MGRGKGRGGDFDDCSTDNPLCVAGCGACVLLAIVGIILFAISWSSLEATEFGFEYNGIAKEINTEKTYEGGRYFLGVSRRFIAFPKTQQTIKFAPDGGADFAPMKARSSDGLQLMISASFQFTIKPDLTSVVALYRYFADDYRSAYVRIARAVLRDCASQFTAFMFFEDRASIISVMDNALKKSLNDVNATLETFNLLYVTLPSAFQQAIQNTQIAKQDILTAENEFQEKLLVAEQTIAVAKETSVVQIRNSEAAAAGLLAQVNTEVKSLNEKLTKEAASYQVLATQLKLNVEQLLAWVWTASIEDQSGVVATLQPPDAAVTRPKNLSPQSILPIKSLKVTRTLSSVPVCMAENLTKCEVSFDVTSCTVTTTASAGCSISANGQSCATVATVSVNPNNLGCSGASIGVLCNCTGDQTKMTCTSGATSMACTNGAADLKKTCR